MRTTGGTTSEPVQLPAWRVELGYANRDIWLARSWFGINPYDRLFLLWGHSHQLGKGMHGQINAYYRQIKDIVLGYDRFSAYDLSDQALRRAGDELLRFRPAWLLGYSVALDRLADANRDREKDFRALNLKAAIATAEAFPRQDSAERITEVLGCRVAMEYGAVESGPVAHQRTDNRFQIFWRHWFVEGKASPDVIGTFEIFLTSLYPRCCPLLRYRIGDLISEDPNRADFDQTFSRVIGRCNDYIALPDGAKIHSEAFTHAIKECDGVSRFQVYQALTGRIYFRYEPLRGGLLDEHQIRDRLKVIHPALREVEFQSVANLPQTIAGKTRTIERERPD